MHFRMNFALTGLVMLLLSLSLVAHAQTSIDADNVLVLRVTPEHPGVFATVHAELKSFSIDLDRTMIVWTVNGTQKKKGQGERLFRFETKGSGSPVEVRVTATTEDGRVFEAFRRFEPAEVELVWQANSYTPPFYKGKALFPYEGSGVAVALPFLLNANGGRIPVSDLIFTWTENDETVADASGVGRSIFPLLSTIPVRPIALKVSVESADGRQYAEKEVVISPIAPQLVFYEDHPLYGIKWGNAITTTFPLPGQELKLSAMPFFFEAAKRSSPFVEYQWRINHTKIESQSGDNLIVRKINDEGGQSLIFGRATVPAKSLQSAERNIYITAEPSLGIFGETETAAAAQ